MLHTVPVPFSIVAEYVMSLNDNYAWHRALQGNKAMHPAILECMDTEHPKDWRQLYLEWPHVSADGRLAYTQNVDKGERNIQTVTTIGRYIAKHFDIPDHVIRALVSKHTASGYELHTDKQTIRDAVINGPKSCMQWGTTDLSDTHPYDAYAPEFGWGICIKKQDCSIMSRALTLAYKGERYFVRTYTRADGYSQRDEQQEQFLIGKGFKHVSSWPDGAKLKKMGMLPYLDGVYQSVDEMEDSYVIYRGGSICCNNTDGSIDDPEEDYIAHCEDCGEGISEGDDYGCIGRHGDNTVCESCLRNSYTYVYGRRGEQYYISDSDAIEVNDDYYDPEYLSDNEIVELENGYFHQDDVFFCEIDEQDYHVDDGQNTDDKGMVHKSNAWQCVQSGDWYSTEIEPVSTQDAGDCHPNNVWQCAASGNWYSNDTDREVNDEGDDVHPDYYVSPNLNLELSVELTPC